MYLYIEIDSRSETKHSKGIELLVVILEQNKRRSSDSSKLVGNLVKNMRSANEHKV